MCYMFVAGKKATADGSVMVARGCDAPSIEACRIVSVPRKKYPQGTIINIPESNNISIPQVEETYAYTAVIRVLDDSQMAEVFGGINEFQLSAGASTGGWVKPEINELTPWPETVIGDYLMTLVLERCKTAREAIKWLGEMTEKYGARTDNYIVADPNEAWIFEQYQGYHWAAARVPDECCMVEANSFRLAEINPEDPENYMCDPDLIPFAIEHGFWDPNSNEPFHASRAYGTNEINRPRGDHKTPYYSLHRIWRGNMLLNKNLDLDPYEPSKEYPLFIKPDHLLTPGDFFSVLKDTYQGTEFDEYGALDDQYETPVDPKTGHYRYSPVWNKSRNIGCTQTVTSWITQSRSWLPNEIGGIFWCGLAAAATSPHLPWYASNTTTPYEYQRAFGGPDGEYMDDSAYWLYENITNIVNLFYQGTVDLVHPIWEQFDQRNLQNQLEIEKTALEIHQKDSQAAIDFLTSYSNGVAMEAYSIGKNMLRKLFTRIALVNNPQTQLAYIPVHEWEKKKGVY